jgi:cytochrome b
MAEPERILVWDLPTRIFHWLLAASFAGAFATGESEYWRNAHVLLGYTAGGLIVFRLLWGIIGTRYARFASFELHPRAALRYLKSLASRSPEHHVGHNPAGSWAILAMLGSVAATALSGWAVLAKIGPQWLEGVHEGLANATVALIAVHVAAVIASSWIHRENLVRAMVTGFKRHAAAAPAERIGWAAGALLIAVVGALWAGWIPAGLDGASLTTPGAVSTAQRGHQADD